MRVAVTGASGFLGNEVIKLLLQDKDCTIVAFTSQKLKLEEIYNSKNLIVYDRNDFKDKHFQNVDVLLNCAFPRNTDGVQMAKGIMYIKEVLEEAVKNDVKKVINISSQSVYSQNKVCPASEDSELSLDSSYAVGKYASELLTNVICKNINHTNIRLASLIGPGFDQRVVNKMVDSAIRNRQIMIMDGVQLFGFMDILDASMAMVSLIKNQNKNLDETYNVGITGGYSLEEIALSIKELTEDVSLKIIKRDGKVNINSTLNTEKFKMQFGELHYRNLKETVMRIIEYKRRQIE